MIKKIKCCIYSVFRSACVTRDIPDNSLVGGVPVKMIRRLENENL